MELIALIMVSTSNGSTLPFPVASNALLGLVGKKLFVQYHEFGLAATGVVLGTGNAGVGLGPTCCVMTVDVGVFG